MRVLVIGAGRTGIQVIRQLQKNSAITVVTADPRSEPLAVEEGVVERLDVTEVITPLNIEKIVAETRSDLVLLAMPTEEMGLGKAPGVDILADALKDELAATSDIPVIEVARGTG